MVRDELSVMSAFLAVADERSFTKAAKRLGVTQSALSHAIRGLEEQVGVRLLARTTRSVAPTEAGEQLLAELRPALTGIRGALDRIGGLRDKPRGRVRLLVPRLAAMSVLGPKLGEFARTYPDVVLDVSTDETRLDLVAGGFDAGKAGRETAERATQAGVVRKTVNVIEVRVHGLILEQKTQQNIVILREIDGDRILPIWIGPAEAQAIRRFLAEESFPRPADPQKVR